MAQGSSAQGGRFNGSAAATKKTTGKRPARQERREERRVTPEAQAAVFQRALAAGDKRVARADQRTEPQTAHRPHVPGT